MKSLVRYSGQKLIEKSKSPKDRVSEAIPKAAPRSGSKQQHSSSSKEVSQEASETKAFSQEEQFAKRLVLSSSDSWLNDAVEQLQDSFLQIFASLLYKYRLLLKPESDKVFDMSTFLEIIKPSNRVLFLSNHQFFLIFLQEFLSSLLQRRCFQVFLNSRLISRPTDVDSSKFEHYVLRNISKKYAFIRMVFLREI